MRRRDRFTIPILLSLTLTSASIAVPLTAATANAAPAPVIVSSSDAATLPEVTMTCAPGQVDINHATKTDLMAGLNLGGPVADRLVAARPFLTPLDLLAVNGIGPGDPSEPEPGSYAAIKAANSACSTPTSTPPPATEACTSADQTDLATAPRDQLMNAFSLSAPVADRLISRRPYSKKEHLRGDRVPGIGTKAQAAIAKKGCLTPSPVRTDTASFRYAYPAYDTTVIRDLYELKVPSGVIDSSAGAWASVTPTAPLDPVAFDIADPAADFHLHGAWADGTQTVNVTLPEAPYLDLLPDTVEWTPVLKHEFSDAPGDGVNVIPTVNTATGQLSANTTSLSVWSAIYAAKDFAQGLLIGNRYGPPSCNPSWQQQAGTSDYRPSFQNTHVTLTDSQLNLPGNDGKYGTFLLHCVGGPNDRTGKSPAVTTIRNNSGAVSIAYDVQNNSSDFKNDAAIRFDQPKTYLSLFTDTSMALTNFVHTGNGTLIGPGDYVDISTPAGRHGVTSISPDVTLTALNAGINATLGGFLTSFAAVSPEAQAQAVYKFADAAQCVYTGLQSLGESDAATMTQAAVRAGYSCFIERQVLVAILSELVSDVWLKHGQTSTLGQQALKGARGTLVVTKLAEFIGSVSDSLLASARQADFVADHYLPPPTVDAQGRPIKDFCRTGAGTVAPSYDQSCQNAYYAQQGSGGVGGTDSNGNALPVAHLVKTRTGNDSYVARQYPDGPKTLASVPSGGDYVCWSRYLPVDWWATVSEYNGAGWAGPVPVAPATCDSSTTAGYPARNLSPSTISATNAIVMRKADGEAFVYVGGGRIEPIPSQAEFLCWVSPQYAANLTTKVWDYVTDAELARFTLDTTGHTSNCGDPANPTF